MNLRAIFRAVCLLLCCFLPAQLHAAAQSPWKAQAISLSRSGRYLAVSFSPDAATNPYATRDGATWLYDLENILAPAVYLTESNFTDVELVFSPDEQYLAVIDFAGLDVFRTMDGRRIFHLPAPTGQWNADMQYAVEFNPDSRYLRAFDIWRKEGRLLPIWDFKSGQLVNNVNSHSQDLLIKMRLTPDWRQLLIDGTIFRFDAVDGIGPVNAILPEASYAAYGGKADAGFNADGSLIALATLFEDEIRIYDTESWTLVASKSLFQEPCEYARPAFSFAQRRPWLAAICPSQDKLFVWNYDADELLFAADTTVNLARFSADDNFLVASDREDKSGKAQISVWDINSNFELVTYPGLSPQLHPKGALMFTIGADGNVWIWDLASRSLQAILPAPTTSGRSI